MKKDYSKNIRLRCVVCGSDNDFEQNEDGTYIKCCKCNREYMGGYDELVSLNQGLIEAEKEAITAEVKKDVEDEMKKMLHNAFKGCKNIKIC